ncbi:hypothetical protein AB0D27_21665 [Streptomyces sp. NPDC048415]|uniref:hypothetical protein n=1 Tax=Streptomyces sp. NPDC048415 TaxID=3154822 RepID=UPI003435F47E
MTTAHSADLWPRPLPPCDTADDPRAAAQLFDGVKGADGPWRPVRPLLVGADTYRDLVQLSRRAAELVLAAARRRADTARDLLAALGSRQEDYPLLDPGDPVGDRLLTAVRPDILMEGGVARFVELNVDGALGGVLQADLLSGRFLDRYHRSGLVGRLGLSAAPSAVRARAEALRTFLGLPRDAAARVLMPHFTGGHLPGLDDCARFADWLAPVFRHARDHGMRMFSHPLTALTTAPDGTLLAGGRAVDAVFRTFVSHGEPPSAGLTALRRALDAGAVRMFTPESTMLLTNKITLAWLWDDLDLLDPADRRLVETHVPRTVRLRPADRDTLGRAVRDRAGWVLKPADGFGGSGVVVGAAADDADWRTALDHAARQGGHVLQRYVDADRTAMRFVRTVDGEVADAEVPYVLGPFLYGLRGSGLLVRHGTPAAADVLNAGRGAAMNTALLAGG